MSSTRIKIQAAVVVFLFLPAVAGVLAVHASATCERFVRTYVTKPVRNRVSKATAVAWAEWGKAHPNWKPNPKLHRPKYIMTQDEAVQKVAFACSIPIVPSTTDMEFPMAETDPPPMINFPPAESTQVTFPDVVPPEVAEITPEETWPSLGPFVPPILGGPVTPGGVPIVPLVPPQYPPVGGDVPEPASLLLASTGIGILFLLAGFRLRREGEDLIHLISRG